MNDWELIRILVWSWGLIGLIGLIVLIKAWWAVSPLAYDLISVVGNWKLFWSCMIVGWWLDRLQAVEKTGESDGKRFEMEIKAYLRSTGSHLWLRSWPSVTPRPGWSAGRKLALVPASFSQGQFGDPANRRTVGWLSFWSSGGIFTYKFKKSYHCDLTRSRFLELTENHTTELTIN